MIKLRPYQIDLSDKVTKLLQNEKFAILSMEVRTGKTITALESIKKYGVRKGLFLTKKKAIHSIEEDYSHYAQDFDLIVVNYESLHKIEGIFDIIILDESHGLSTFPKPGLKYKNIKKRFGDLPMILLSGTLSTESYSQYFHQIHVSNNTVWKKYKNFYRWADDFVKVSQIKTSYGWANDYSKADYNKIMKDVGHYILTFTQKEAGFTTEVEEKILHVEMKKSTYDLIKRLQDDKIIEGAKEEILADTMVKEQQKVHQMYSGTIKFESGNTMILDDSKARFIKRHFKGKKIGIYYNFKAEKDLLFKTFGKEFLTDDLQVFNKTNKNIALQIVSGREGISLREADCLVFYNIAFSALSYWQARDRLTTMDRKFNTVYWIFAKGGLEDKIYKAVLKKKDFTTKLYARTTNPKEDNQLSSR